jgi:hypothetical protein
VVGIAAMVLTGVLGTAMGLNNTATFMSSCVVFVAVAMWMDSRILRRRRVSAAESAREPAVQPGEDARLDVEQPDRDSQGG